MTPKQINSTMLYLAATAAMIMAAGCGGSGSGGISPSASANPGMPETGNFQAPFAVSGSSSSNGSLLINSSGGGAMSMSAGVSGTPGLYTGTTTVASNDTFSTTLTNPSNGQTTTATGTTYGNNIKMSLSGAVNSGTISASYKGTNNLFSGTYNGSISGATLGTETPMSLNVNTSSSANVAGSMTTTTFGTLNIAGTLSPVGSFTASIPYGVLGDSMNLTGTFTIGANGKAQGSGTWIDALNVNNTGTWTASEN